MMTDRDFSNSLWATEPPKGLTHALRGLWYAAKGNWDKARSIIENDSSANSACVAGHIHCTRGDIRAARSWYIRAERPAPNTPPELERALITRILLAIMNDRQAA